MLFTLSENSLAIDAIYTEQIVIDATNTKCK